MQITECVQCTHNLLPRLLQLSAAWYIRRPHPESSVSTKRGGADHLWMQKDAFFSFPFKCVQQQAIVTWGRWQTLLYCGPMKRETPLVGLCLHAPLAAGYNQRQGRFPLELRVLV